MRRAAKVDANQSVIVEVLRKAGCSVAITSALGGGFPDLVVGRHGFNILMEVKDGDKPPSERKLTPKEAEFQEGWFGQYVVVESPEQAISAVAEVLQGRLPVVQEYGSG